MSVMTTATTFHGMVDLSIIGKAGLIIQYEDCVSLIGFNIAKEFRQIENHKFNSMSIQDILLSYVNRESEDYVEWLKENDVSVDPKEMLKSFKAMQPTLSYSFRVFSTASSEKLNNLIIYSNEYSPIAEQSASVYGTDVSVKYKHSNIIDFINKTPNMTLITSSHKTIRECVEINAPLCLVICDDFGYLADLYDDGTISKLEKKDNILLRYTSVLSGGVI